MKQAVFDETIARSQESTSCKKKMALMNNIYQSSKQHSLTLYYGIIIVCQ